MREPAGVGYVGASDHHRLRDLRLAALAADPRAFASTHATEAARPEEWWREWAQASERGTQQRTFVLDDGRRWLGLALVRLREEAPGAAFLNAMWIVPEARGRGGSARLCDACAAWAGERGCRELKLGVLDENDGARRVYEAAGFAVTGRGVWPRDGELLPETLMSRRV